MFAGTAGDAFELERHLPDFAGILVDGEEVAQRLLHLVGLLEGHAHFERDHLRQTVGQAIGLALDPRHVTHHRLGRHGAEGDDLAHRIAPVRLGHVIDDPVAAVHAEVDVEVGHGNTFGVEEALEQQVVGQRIEVGDLQHVGHQRAGTRTAARADRHAVVLGPLDEVHNDQEVTGKAHLNDGAQFELEAVDIDLLLRLVVRRVLWQQDFQALLQALERDLTQVIVDGHAFGNREVRQEVGAQLHFDVAAFGDLDGVFQRLGQVGEQLGHLLGRLQVLLIGVGTRASRVVQSAPFTDADAGFMRLEVFLFEKAHVVGRHQRRAAALGQRHGRMQMLFVIDPIGALHFQVEAIGEYLAPFGKTRRRQRFVAIEQSVADLPFLGTGKRNQPFGRFLDPLPLDDDQIVALAFGPAARNQLGEIAISLGVHRQQRQAAERTILVAASQPDIGATDRFDSGALRRLVELHQRAHVAHVGHRHRGHSARRHRLDQRLDAHQAIDQRVLGMQTEMDEGSRHEQTLSWQNDKRGIVPESNRPLANLPTARAIANRDRRSA